MTGVVRLFAVAVACTVGFAVPAFAEAISLGLPAPGSKSSEDFSPPAGALAALAAASGSVELSGVPVSSTDAETAVLEPVEVFTGATYTAMTADGPEERPLPAIRFFRGETTSATPSTVFLSVTEGRNLFLGVWGRDGVLRVGVPINAQDASSTAHAFGAGEAKRASTPEGFCNADALLANQKKVAGFQEPAAASKAGGTLAFDLMLDIGNELFVDGFGGSDVVAASYIGNVIGSVSSIYDRDVDVILQIGSLYIWESGDPIDQTDTYTQLDDYLAYCQANRSGEPRTVAHYFGANGGGGLAYLDVLCSTSFGYGVSNLDADATFPVSGYHWDLGVTAHELGHNFGSPHTHCYVPPIDCCYNAEPGCNCGTVNPISGTIMSYCHLVNSIHLDFSTREQSVIRAVAEAASCNVTPDYPLAVTPSIAAFGGTPGNIGPANRQVSVINSNGSASVNWAAAGPQLGVLFDLSPSSGTLAANGVVNLTLTPTAAALNLVPGVVESTLTFTNLSTNATTEITFRVTIAVVYEGLDTDPSWTTTGQWAFGVPLGGSGDFGGEDPTSGATGSNVYGYNLAGSYPDFLPQRTLTTPPFDLGNYRDLRLGFMRWLNVESRQYDRAAVEASTDGSQWTVLWENPTSASVSDDAWVPVDLALPAAFDNQETVYFRWVMGPTDSSFNFGGWNIDDIAVTGTFDPPYSAAVRGPQWVEVDDTFSLSLEAEGFTGTPTYQWFLDGAPISGETGAAYTVGLASTDDTGFYTCEITNGSKADYVTPGFYVEVFPAGALPLGGIALAGTVVLSLAYVGARRTRRH